MTIQQKLSDEQWNALQDVAERYEKDCHDAFPRKVADYLPSRSDPMYAIVLDELLNIDLELHWRNGQGILIDDYLTGFPEIRSDRNRMMSLIEEEFRVRRAFGDHPSAESYIVRFPDHGEAISHRLASGGSQEFTTHQTTVEIPFASSGNLKKIRRIGEGGFGEVWECRAPGGVPVAVKKIFATVSPSLIEREKQSLDLICSGKFRHPFLLQVFGWWVQNDQIHIVMELADESLDNRLKSARAAGEPGLPMDDLLQQVMLDAGEALDFLNYKCRILHRDVKPANMLLMSERLKMCDFGLARMSKDLTLGMGKTMGAGTPVFIAPEIVQGYQARQSDQYSLAASYCMLRSGRPLFRGTVAEIRDQHVHAAPDLTDRLFTPDEELVLLKALSKEPGDRFASSTEFTRELVAAAGGRPRASRPSRETAEVASVVTEPAANEIVASSRFKPVRRSRPTKITQQLQPTADDSRRPPMSRMLMMLALTGILILGVLLGLAGGLFFR